MFFHVSNTGTKVLFKNELSSFAEEKKKSMLVLLKFEFSNLLSCISLFH